MSGVLQERRSKSGRFSVGRGVLRGLAGVLLLATMLGASCGETVVDPVSEIHVTAIESPVGDIVPVGARVTLVATTAEITPGVAAGTGIAWASSDPTVASVDNLGVVDALAPGIATITARWDGPGASLDLTVANPDMQSIGEILLDPHPDQLIAALEPGVAAGVGAAWALCETARSSTLTELIDCLTEVRAELAGSTAPEHAPAVGFLSLLADWVEALVYLP